MCLRNSTLWVCSRDDYGTPVEVIKDPRDGHPAAETDLSWNAADRLLSLTTPNQVNAGSGKSYSYQYDALGNMTKATDPLNRSTEMSYYYNRLQTLTEADGSTVQHVWDPVNLNQDTRIDQTLNSQAYSYHQGNVTTASNLLGVADNRVLNGGFEQLSGQQPVNWSAYTPIGSIDNQVDSVSVTVTAEGPFADSSGNSHVLHINPGTNPYAYQWTNYINLTGPTTDPFTVSAYLKTGQTGTSDGACINVY